jgi:formylglycine-generating enzyme required for sulfatase activity
MGWGRGRQPVIGVTWEDARTYVSWLAKKTGKPYRLLSEAEWEYAARGGTTTRYPWGDDAGSNRANYRGSGSKWSDQGSAPVGSFEPNRFGLHDMIGNVGEWVQDCMHDTYDGAPLDGSAWESSDCTRRVVRGGSYNRPDWVVRAACRVGGGPGSLGSALGFRVVVSPFFSGL